MDERQMTMLTAGVGTKADKMRILEREGVPRADIARFLGVRYQQVRNTLEGDRRTGYSPDLGVGPRTRAAVPAADDYVLLQRNEEGGLVLPLDLVEEALGAEAEQVIAISVNDGLFLTSVLALVDRARRSLNG
jgi:hypothetical protein